MVVVEVVRVGLAEGQVALVEDVVSAPEVVDGVAEVLLGDVKPTLRLLAKPGQRVTDPVGCNADFTFLQIA